MGSWVGQGKRAIDIGGDAGRAGGKRAERAWLGDLGALTARGDPTALGGGRCPLRGSCLTPKGCLRVCLLLLVFSVPASSSFFCESCSSCFRVSFKLFPSFRGLVLRVFYRIFDI